MRNCWIQTRGLGQTALTLDAMDISDLYRSQGYAVFDGKAKLEDQLKSLDLIFDKISKDYNSGEKKSSFLLMPHRLFPEIVDALKTTAICEILESLLGGPVDLVHTQVMFNPPGTKGFSPHQDNWYNRSQTKHHMLAAWMPLETAQKENGGLYLYPESHKMELLRPKINLQYLGKELVHLIKQKTFAFLGQQDPFNRVDLSRLLNTPTPYSLGDKKIDVELERGQILFFDGHLIHGSYDNLSHHRTRRVLLANFVRRGTLFRKGIFSKRSPIPFGSV